MRLASKPPNDMLPVCKTAWRETMTLGLFVWLWILVAPVAGFLWMERKFDTPNLL
jgi:hypothetical protein